MRLRRKSRRVPEVLTALIQSPVFAAVIQAIHKKYTTCWREASREDGQQAVARTFLCDVAVRYRDDAMSDFNAFADALKLNPSMQKKVLLHDVLQFMSDNQFDKSRVVYDIGEDASAISM